MMTKTWTDRPLLFKPVVREIQIGDVYIEMRFSSDRRTLLDKEVCEIYDRFRTALEQENHGQQR